MKCKSHRFTCDFCRVSGTSAFGLRYLRCVPKTVGGRTYVLLMTTTTSPDERPWLLREVVALREQASQLSAASVWSMADRDVAEVAIELDQLVGQLNELKLRCLHQVARTDFPTAAGAVDAVAWWQHATRRTSSTARGDLRLAHSLDRDESLARAMAAGALLHDQAAVIAKVTSDLDQADVPPEAVSQARDYLLDESRNHDSRVLRRLGQRVLEYVAPELAEDHERRQIEAEEREALTRASFSMQDLGDGTWRGRFILPDLQAAMLRRAVEALSSKHREQGRRATEFQTRLGLAFCEYVETQSQSHTQAGLPATVVITTALTDLQSGASCASLDTGERISPGQLRRLCCGAGLIPAVLGGASQPLDVGRERRLHTKAMRVALHVRDDGCTAQDCDLPVSRCQAHHDPSWSQGGNTNVKDARLLCWRHHR